MPLDHASEVWVIGDHAGNLTVQLAAFPAMQYIGQAVRRMLDFYKLEPENVLVLHDELDLPPGTVRLKQGGGHGGHNGLRDIIERKGSDRGDLIATLEIVLPPAENEEVRASGELVFEQAAPLVDEALDVVAFLGGGGPVAVHVKVAEEAGRRHLRNDRLGQLLRRHLSDSARGHVDTRGGKLNCNGDRNQGRIITVVYNILRREGEHKCPGSHSPKRRRPQAEECPGPYTYATGAAICHEGHTTVANTPI